VIPTPPAIIAAATPVFSAIDPALQTALFKRAKNSRAVLIIGRRIGDAANFEFLGATDAPHADANTLFPIDGLTEAITGVLLADAVRRGEVQLDETVADLHDADFHPSPSVTLSELATHHAGFPGVTLRQADQPYATIDRAALAALVNAPRAQSTAYAPSVVDYGLLGNLLADRAAMSYAGLARDRIFVPLDMGNSVADTGSDARLVPGRAISDEPAAPWRYNALAPAGGVRSTLFDLLHFAGEMFDNENGPLAADMKLAATPRAQGDGSSIGLGWHVASDGRAVWASGGSYGSTAFLAIAPRDHVAVIILCNVGIGFGNATFDDLGLRLLADTVRGAAAP
jgi:CubicO group peptidase (beta-lactamase class C family)